MNRNRGLTLIEILAAAALLSLVATSGLGMLRQARSGQRRALELAQATAVIQRWCAEVDDDQLRRWVIAEPAGPREPPPPPPSWEYVDPSGERWRAIVNKVDAPPPESPSPGAQRDPGAAWRPRWLNVSFECDPGTPAGARKVTSFIRAFPPEAGR